MAQKNSKLPYDVAIIGGGLSALITAHLFKQQAKSVVLICPESDLGGEYKSFHASHPITQGMDYLPDFPRTDLALAELSKFLDHPLIAHRFDIAPLTYDSGDFKDFNGFGKEAPHALEPISQFIRSSHFQRLQNPLGQWVTHLIESLLPEEKILEHVTKIVDHESETMTIELNGQKTIEAHDVFFAQHPTQLTQLIQSPHVQLKLNQRLNKRGFWTSIRLTLVHSEVVSAEESVHMLMGAKKDPVIGIFDRALNHASTHSTDQEAPQVTQVSRWVAFIPHDVTEDAEFVAQTLREMKKQIMRAYPEAFNRLAFERVRVGAADWGPVGEILGGDIQLKKLNRFWLSGAMFSTASGLLAELEQPLKAFKHAMGFQSESVQTEPGPEAEI